MRTEFRRHWASIGSRDAVRTLVGMAVGATFVICLNIVLQVRLNTWQGAFFDAIGQRDIPSFVRELFVFAAIVTGLLVFVVAQTWLQERMKVVLREMVTRSLLDSWLAPLRVYQLTLSTQVGEHPDQRIHEDARHLTELTVDLGVGLVQASLLLVTFVGVLWTLSSGMSIPWRDGTIEIPGYLVWWALAYAIVGSAFTRVFGAPLIAVNAERYAREAELRFQLVRIGENATRVSLYGGEEDERRVAFRALDSVIVISRKLADRLARLTWITSAYGWGTLVVPVIAVAPPYFAGALSLGGLMMAVGAFNQVQQSLRWYVDNFPRIADWRATLRRVDAIRAALTTLDAPDPETENIVRTEDAVDEVTIEALTIEVGNGEAVVESAPVRIGRGEHVLIVGDPGAGKSTLFLTLAGLWRRGVGRIRMPARDRSIFMPQRPYMPPGTLRGVILYPGPPNRFAHADICNAMERVGIGHLIGDLDRQNRWDRDLPLDEQQLVALVRVLLWAPDWVFMDDAMSSLDETRRAACLALLARTLPRTAVVATSRSPARDGFWSRVVHLHRTQPLPHHVCEPGSHAGPALLEAAGLRAPS
ncbi:ABC transporter ATP-binding protein/permease [Alsobacter sp. SYSU M60028]|uniref:ABC transporter ATP-binding protein/permease n=1 Tax=Alsobacter ponti TaxID=2962936 RepID=A0ABT1LJ52_9HYPH|nr:ABC transporter ATP-binding protein/permease [Alsobacter ponti]MCP8940971.1 ABC transporter ATP-binding protein/permease [Alsobacter ponti]